MRFAERLDSQVPTLQFSPPGDPYTARFLKHYGLADVIRTVRTDYDQARALASCRFLRARKRLRSSNGMLNSGTSWSPTP